MDFIQIQNDGPEIISTNYWGMPHAQKGYYFLSINAGCFRLLVPDLQISEIIEWESAREVIISRGPWPQMGRPDAVEILFEDDSDNPYAIHIVPDQVDRMPLVADQAKPWIFNLWTRYGKRGQFPAHYRIVPEIPCLKKWEA